MEYIFVFRTPTDGHGDSRSEAVKASNPADAWERFHEQHPQTLWVHLQGVRRPMW